MPFFKSNVVRILDDIPGIFETPSLDGIAIEMEGSELSDQQYRIDVVNGIQIEEKHISPDNEGHGLRITVGTSIQKGTQARKDILPLGKEAKKQIVKFKRGTEKLQKAAKGTETGEVIAEGLHGPTTLGKQLAEKGWKISKEATTKPPWWQATIPPFLRTGKGVWNPYKGAYPPQVSALRVGGTGTGIGLLAYNFPRAGDIMEAQKEKENILSPEDILKTEMDKWAAAFNPEAITEEVDISLPERIE